VRNQRAWGRKELTETVGIDKLTPDARNANQGTKRGLDLLDESLRQNGAGRSVLLDKHNRVIAGNKTVERAADVGIDDVVIVDSDGSKLVAVRRTDLDLETDPRARQLAYADNRVAEVDLAWDPSQIAADLEAGLDLSGMFYPEELSALLEQAADAVIGATATDRDQQGVNSTWDQVKGAAADRVVIGEIETRLPQPVIDRVVGVLRLQYEKTRAPVHETLEAILLAGIDPFENSDS